MCVAMASHSLALLQFLLHAEPVVYFKADYMTVLEESLSCPRHQRAAASHRPPGIYGLTPTFPVSYGTPAYLHN